jgi:hypothetical protein
MLVMVVRSCPFPDLFVAEAEIGRQLFEGYGYLDGIEVLALDVFNQGDFKEAVVMDVSDDDGHLLQPGEAGGPPTALTGNEMVLFADLPDDEGLDDPIGLDRSGQLLEASRVEDGAGLIGVRLDLVNR